MSRTILAAALLTIFATGCAVAQSGGGKAKATVKSCADICATQPGISVRAKCMQLCESRRRK